MSESGGAADHHRLRVGADAVGVRLDVFLARQLEASRSQVRKLLTRGAVRLDGIVQGPTDKGASLTEGSIVEVEDFLPPADQAPDPEPDAPLALLARGEGWIAIEKPSGVPVHPLDRGEHGSVLGAVCARWPEIVGVGEGGLRSGVVHRLDVATSGVLLMATTQSAWERLRTAFRSHVVDKRYLAIASGRIDAPATHRVGLRVAQHRPARVVVVDPREPGARTGVLHVRPIERLAGATLVEVKLETGFLHQIRATLAHLGHAVLGDPIYAPPEVLSAAPRLALHASAVCFEEIAAESPLPPDLTELVEKLRAA